MGVNRGETLMGICWDMLVLQEGLKEEESPKLVQNARLCSQHRAVLCTQSSEVAGSQKSPP